MFSALLLSSAGCLVLDAPEDSDEWDVPTAVVSEEVTIGDTPFTDGQFLVYNRAEDGDTDGINIALVVDEPNIADTIQYALFVDGELVISEGNVVVETLAPTGTRERPLNARLSHARLLDEDDFVSNTCHRLELRIATDFAIDPEPAVTLTWFFVVTEDEQFSVLLEECGQ